MMSIKVTIENREPSKLIDLLSEIKVEKKFLLELSKDIKEKTGINVLFINSLLLLSKLEEEVKKKLEVVNDAR